MTKKEILLLITYKMDRKGYLTSFFYKLVLVFTVKKSQIRNLISNIIMALPAGNHSNHILCPVFDQKVVADINRQLFQHKYTCNCCTLQLQLHTIGGTTKRGNTDSPPLLKYAEASHTTVCGLWNKNGFKRMMKNDTAVIFFLF